MYSNNQVLDMETMCESLLLELQKIWDEIGEHDIERDKMLLELEQECLEVYKRKVDHAQKGRAQLRQAIADAETELADICSSMGERPIHVRQFDQSSNGSLKEKLSTIIPLLEEMRTRRSDRRNQFVEVMIQVRNISNDIHGSADVSLCKTFVDDVDLSLKRLEELHRQLIELQIEKSNRLKQVLDHLSTLKSLCVVLGTDFKHTISEIHPSLDDSKEIKSISNETIDRLATAIKNLREVKVQRMQRLQDLATAMLEFWNLMDTQIEEQLKFQNVTKNVAASEHEITEPNTLSLEFISYAEAEVSRLEQLKSSKMKEIVLKKKLELDDICRKTHMVLDAQSVMEYSVEAIESGAVDPAFLLDQIELQIAKVKEEAFSRKEILEKLEKWLASCEEECWLEEYNRDDSRYNAGRGTHLTLKRAEKARALYVDSKEEIGGKRKVEKLGTAMVEALTLKVVAWEKEKGVEFSYDGIQLLSMLEQYTILKQEKEQERQRQRDQKKIQEQMMAEQEALFGSKPSPSKSGKKMPRYSMGGAANRRISLGGAMLQASKQEKSAMLHPRPLRKGDHMNQNSLNRQNFTGFTAPSTGNRNSKTAGNPAKKLGAAANAHEIESPLVRKPFSPVTSTMSSKANITKCSEEENRKSNGKLQKMLPSSKTQMTTPPKLVCVDEKNKTPKTMPTPTPDTPSLVSVPMQTAITPAPLCVKEVGKVIEISFEELRAGFLLPPKTYTKTLLQV